MAALTPFESNGGRSSLYVILGLLLALSLGVNLYLGLKYRGLSREMVASVTRADDAERQVKLIGEKLEARLKEAETGARSLAQEKDQLSQSLAESKRDLQRLIEEGGKKTQQMQMLEAQLKEAETGARSLAQENRSLKDKIAEMKKEHDSTIANLLEYLLSEESALKMRVDALVRDKEKLRESLEQSQRDLQAQIEEGRQKTQQMQMLEAQIKSADGISRRADELRAQLASQTDANAKLNAQISQREETIGKLRLEKAELIEKNKTISDKIARIERAAQAATESDPRFISMRKKIGELEAALLEASSEKESLKERYTKVVDEISKELSAEEIKSSSLREKFDERLKAKEEEVRRLKRTYESLMGNLKDEIRRKEVTIVSIRDMLSVNMVNKILFGSGQATLRPEGKQLLDKIVTTLKENEGDKEIIVEGHTDNMPISEDLSAVYPTNWELSTARATAVVRHLLSTGIRGDSLSATGHAFYRPVASNETSEGRKQNRRIEILLRPKEAWRR